MKIKGLYLIVAALLLVFFPYLTISANDSDTPLVSGSIANQKALQAAINRLDIQGGEIRLSQDVTLYSTLYFPQDNPVTIDGNGHTLSIAPNVESRHISISSNNNHITLKNITLSGNGMGNVGGGLSVSGTLILEDCVIDDCFAPNGGSIIISGGSVLMKSSKVSNNGSYGYGGGIHIGSNGVLSAYDSEFSNNSAIRGGALFATGGNSTQYAVFAENCRFEGNEAKPHGSSLVMGGAIAAEGENTGIKLVASRLNGNTSAGIAGGLYAGGMLEAVDCEISNNSAAGNGGGAYVAYKALISGGQICANEAIGSGGGIYTDSKALKHFSVKGTSFGENRSDYYISWQADSLSRDSGTLYPLLLSSGAVSVKEYTGQSDSEGNVFNGADINIVAKCDIVFSADGGKWQDGTGDDRMQHYYLGDPIILPDGLTKAGRSPAGWKTEAGEIIDEDYRITGAATLYPVWERAAAVETDGPQSAPPTDADETDGQRAAEGMDNAQSPAAGSSLAAKTYTVLYTLQGSPSTRSETVTDGSRLNKPIVNFDGHKLKGWYISGTDIKWDFDNDVVSGDLTLEARWE